MRAGQIRLDAPTAHRLTTLVRSQKSSGIIRAVQGIAAKYLPPAVETPAKKAGVQTPIASTPSAKQATMGKIGILFDIDALGSGLYGYAAYQIFFEAIDTQQLAGCSLSDGDTRATLAGRANQYCIAVESLDASKIAAVKDALGRSDAKGLLPLASRFVETAQLAGEPLVAAARINAAGELVGDRAGWVTAAWKKSREKHSGPASAPVPS
jgi:hypothetical protein